MGRAMFVLVALAAGCGYSFQIKHKPDPFQRREFGTAEEFTLNVRNENNHSIVVNGTMKTPTQDVNFVLTVQPHSVSGTSLFAPDALCNYGNGDCINWVSLTAVDSNTQARTRRDFKISNRATVTAVFVADEFN